MKKQIITGITIIACVALYAAVWLRSTEVGDLPVEPVKTAVTTEFESSVKELPTIFHYADTHAPEAEVIAEIEAPRTDITAEEKTEAAQSIKPVSKTASPRSATTKPSPQHSSNPKPGDKAVIDGKPHMWIPSFGWIEDEGGGSIGRVIDGKGDINKQVGVMGGGTTVGNPGDELTGNKVGNMGGGTVAEDMCRNGHKSGIMGGSESPLNTANSPASE